MESVMFAGSFRSKDDLAGLLKRSPLLSWIGNFSVSALEVVFEVSCWALTVEQQIRIQANNLTGVRMIWFDERNNLVSQELVR